MPYAYINAYAIVWIIHCADNSLCAAISCMAPVVLAAVVAMQSATLWSNSVQTWIRVNAEACCCISFKNLGHALERDTSVNVFL